MQECDEHCTKISLARFHVFVGVQLLQYGIFDGHTAQVCINSQHTLLYWHGAS